VDKIPFQFLFELIYEYIIYKSSETGFSFLRDEVIECVCKGTEDGSAFDARACLYLFIIAARHAWRIPKERISRESNWMA